MPKRTEPRWMEYLDLDAVEGAPRNPKGHDDPGIDASLAEFGYVEAITMDERTGRLVAGHGRLARLRAARDAGEDPPEGIVAKDGQWLLPVQRGWASRDDDHAEGYLIASNRLTESGGWQREELAEVLTDLRDRDFPLDAIGYGDGALDDLLIDLARRKKIAPDDVDRPRWEPPPRQEPRTAVGDLWLCGPHRLIVGSAYDENVRSELIGDSKLAAVYTDPPYGMALETDYQAMHKDGPVGVTKKWNKVIGDDEDFDASGLIDALGDVAEQFWWGADYYRTTIPAGGSWIVWDKRSHPELDLNLDDALGSQFELCWSRQQHRREIARILWSGYHGMSSSTVKADRERVHPTQKPIALHRWFLERWVPEGRAVLDLFAGSGGTMIAADLADRHAYLAELDPRYATVILYRYQQHTGQQPILASSGEAVDFADVDPQAVVAVEETEPQPVP